MTVADRKSAVFAALEGAWQAILKIVEDRQRDEKKMRFPKKLSAKIKVAFFDTPDAAAVNIEVPLGEVPSEPDDNVTNELLDAEAWTRRTASSPGTPARVAT